MRRPGLPSFFKQVRGEKLVISRLHSKRKSSSLSLPSSLRCLLKRRYPGKNMETLQLVIFSQKKRVTRLKKRFGLLPSFSRLSRENLTGREVILARITRTTGRVRTREIAPHRHPLSSFFFLFSHHTRIKFYSFFNIDLFARSPCHFSHSLLGNDSVFFACNELSPTDSKREGNDNPNAPKTINPLVSNLFSLLIFFKLSLYNFVMRHYYPFVSFFINLTIKYVAENVTLITLTVTKGHGRIRNWI